MEIHGFISCFNLKGEKEKHSSNKDRGLALFASALELGLFVFI